MPLGAQSFYDLSTQAPVAPSAFVAYIASFVEERSKMNRLLMEQRLKRLDPEALLRAEMEARKSAAQLRDRAAWARSASESAKAGLHGDLVKAAASIQVAGIHSATEITGKKLDYETTREEIRGREIEAQRVEDAKLDPTTLPDIHALPENLDNSRTSDPDARTQEYLKIIEAKISANKYAAPGSRQRARIALEAWRTANEAGDADAQAAIEESYGLTDDPEGYFSSTFGVTTSEQIQADVKDIARRYLASGGDINDIIADLESAGFTKEQIAGLSESTSTSSRSALPEDGGASSGPTGSASPTSSSVRVKGSPTDVQRYLAAGGSGGDPAVEAEIARLTAVADALAAERQRATDPTAIFTGMEPNYLLANQFRRTIVPRTLVRNTAALTQMEPARQEEVLTSINRGRGDPRKAEQDIAQSGGSSANPLRVGDAANYMGADDDGGPLVDWLEEALTSSLGREVQGSGGYRYWHGPDGSVTILEAPDKDVVGKVYKADNKSKAAEAIRAEIGEYDGVDRSDSVRAAILSLPKADRPRFSQVLKALDDGSVHDALVALNVERVEDNGTLRGKTTAGVFADLLDEAVKEKDATMRRAKLQEAAELAESFGDRAPTIAQTYLHRYEDLAPKGDVHGLVSDAVSILAGHRQGREINRKDKETQGPTAEDKALKAGVQGDKTAAALVGAVPTKPIVDPGKVGGPDRVLTPEATASRLQARPYTEKPFRSTAPADVPTSGAEDFQAEIDDAIARGDAAEAARLTEQRDRRIREQIRLQRAQPVAP